jgi:hypothetical protein
MLARLFLGFILLLQVGCQKAAVPAAGDDGGDRPALESKLKQLLAQRVDSARQARIAVQAAFEAGSITIDVLLWANDAVYKAELAAADAPEERIAAHIKRVQNFGQLLNGVESLYNVGARGGEAEKYAAVKYCLETAQIALVDACVADGQPYPAVLAPLQNRPKIDHDDDDAEEAGQP